MITLNYKTTEGEEVKFDSIECKEHFLHMKERDQQQIALSQQLYEKKFPNHFWCAYCEAVIKES